MDRKFYTDMRIKRFFVIDINMSKKSKLGRETLSKKV